MAADGGMVGRRYTILKIVGRVRYWTGEGLTLTEAFARIANHLGHERDARFVIRPDAPDGTRWCNSCEGEGGSCLVCFGCGINTKNEEVSDDDDLPF